MRTVAQAETQNDKLALVRSAPFALEDELKIHRAMISRGKFRPFGRLIAVYYDLAAGAAFPKDEVKHYGLHLDWLQEGPTVAISPEGKLLIVSPLPERLPDLPVPGQKPQRARTEKEVRKMPQRYRDRASGVWGDYFVFQPLHQAICQSAERIAFADVKFYTDAEGRQAALLIDPNRREGFFIGGRFVVTLKG